MNNKEIAPNRIDKYFQKADFSLNSKQLKQFEILYNLLNKHNEKLDLSRLKTFNSILDKHFIDSIYVNKLIKLPTPLLDIGTGPGFPGIPLKIINPGLKIILAEPRHKRVAFLEMVINELELKNIEIYPHLVTDKSFFEVQGVITRALETIDKTLSRVDHFLPHQGQVIFMKGPEVVQDLKTISKNNQNNYKIKQDISYQLPQTDYKRRLVLFTKKNSHFQKTYRIIISDSNPGTVIQSTENKKFKRLKQLASFEKFNKTKKLIVSGKKVILELVQNKIKYEELIIFDGYQETDKNFEELISGTARANKLLILKKSLFSEIDINKTNNPLLVVEPPLIENWAGTLKPGCNLLIPFQDPTNVGTVIRSALGLGVTNIIILQEGASPFHPKAIRSSAGAIFRANLKKGPSLYELEKIIGKKGIKLIALDQHGQDIKKITFPEKFILLPGLEGKGLPKNFRPNSVSIPIETEIESLNAAVSTSIALYEWKR